MALLVIGGEAYRDDDDSHDNAFNHKGAAALCGWRWLQHGTTFVL